MKRIRTKAINRKGCKSCKSRNKRCDKVDNTKCSYCKKRDIPCEAPDFAPILYQIPCKSKSHKAVIINQKDQINHIPDLGDINVSNYNLSVKHSVIMDFLLFILANKGQRKLPGLSNSIIKSPEFSRLYQKSVEVFGDVLEEIITEIPVINAETAVEKRTQDLFDLTFEDLSQFLISIPVYLQNFSKSAQYSVSLKYSHRYPQEYSIKENILLKNVDNVDFKNELFVEAPSLVVDDFNEKLAKIEGRFVNLPNYIPVQLVEFMISNFCINFPKETSKMLYVTNDFTNLSLNEFTRTIERIYLTLGFSNIVVLKAILLWSAHNLHLRPDNNLDLSFKTRLQNEIIEDLNNRMSYVSSVCCDHTLAIVLLLYEVQLLVSEIDPVFWFRLNHLIVKSMSLRGGFLKLEGSSNGKFFRKVFCSHYYTKFCYNIIKHDISVLNIEDVESVFDIPTTGELHPYYICMKELCSVAGKTFHCYNLLKLARNSGDLNEGNILNKYQSLNINNARNIMTETDNLERKLTKILIPSEENNTEFDSKSMIQILEFMKEALILLFYQLIHNRTSNSTPTIIHVKKLIPLLQEVFEIYLNKDINVYLILPILLVGCDLCDSFHRNWYIEYLEKLCRAKKHPKFRTIQILVRKIWYINGDGNTYVSWPEISEDNGLIPPLYL